MNETTIRIAGMSCQHCIRAVFTALAGVNGVRRADVGIGGATIEHEGTLDVDAVRAAVELAGYELVGHIMPQSPRRGLPVL